MSCPIIWSCRYPTMCPMPAPCWAPTWKRRSMRCGMRDRASVTGLPWSGGGVVGCFVAALCARPAGNIGTACRYQSGAGGKRRRGWALVLPPPDKADGRPGYRRACQRRHPPGLTAALGLAGFEATVLEMSWYGDRMVPAPLGEAFHSRRLVLKSSQVGPCRGQPPRTAYASRPDAAGTGIIT